MKKPSIDDLEALLHIFQASDYAELNFETDGFEVFLSDDAQASLPSAGAPSPSAPIAPSPSGGSASVSADAELAGLVALTAPSLGHFYRSPKPGVPPFVDLGHTVDVHDTVCVIEVMKLFTLLEAGRRGIVRRICVEDGALVEFGQALMYLEPLP